MKHIAILDFGSQYTHLIARRVRELNVLAKIYPANISHKKLLLDNILGIVISGGPQSVSDTNSIKINKKILALKKPILGLCYGHQLIAHTLGGIVKPGNTREYGKAKLNIKNESKLFKGVSKKNIVWMSHGDSVVKLPVGFKSIGSTSDCKIAAMQNIKEKIYGLQFHPEVHHSVEGGKIIENFVFKICNAQKNWHVKDVVDDLILKIKKQVKNKNVFILASGGVDSSVAFALLTKALGCDRVLGLYVDTGFMRLNETEEIQNGFTLAGFDNLVTHKASQDFFASLKNIYDPEVKRQIIGQVFLDAKDEAFAKLKLNSKNWLLGQGTIYPDTIETGGTKHADTIKTHHNRIDAIEKMVAEGKVIEPLVDFYKDEVREIGNILGLPANLIKRHPFPGPGLAIRCLCSRKSVKSIKSKVNLEEKFVKNLNYALLPIKSVGVQGDNRTYAHPLAVWGEDNWSKLDKISRNITNNSTEVNRVLLLLNPNKQNKFSLPDKNYDLNRKRIELLRKIDAIVMAQIKDAGLYDKIWQFPVVLVPVGKNIKGEFKESIVLRPIISREAMTADFAKIKKDVLNKIVKQILATGEISYIFYDITNKPPGTIEWE